MSKGLKALEQIGDAYVNLPYSVEYLTVKNELKALEIIKNKLLVGCFSKEDNYSKYAMAITMSSDETLKKNMMTEQEYNLLKEVLGNE